MSLSLKPYGFFCTELSTNMPLGGMMPDASGQGSMVYGKTSIMSLVFRRSC